MNDEQLTRLFRSLEDAAEPSPDFADTLFARLERETGLAAARRKTSVRWVLLAAALLLAAAVGATIAVGSGLLKLPSAEASPTPLASSSALPTGSPTEVPSASPAQTPVPTASIPEPTTIDKVLATHDGFLAIGTASIAVGSNDVPENVPVVLHGSSDAGTWQSVDVTGFGQIVDAAASASSEIILAHGHELGGKDVVWRSTDGVSWTPETTWTALSNPQPAVTAAGPAGFLILGGPGQTTDVWTSANGITWTHGSIGPDIVAATVVDGGFLAYSPPDGKIFASLDGLAWQVVPSPADASGTKPVSSIFAVGSRVVALACEPGRPSSCSVWMSTLLGSAGSLNLQWTPAADAQLMNGYTVTATAGTSAGGFMWGYDFTTYGRVAWTSTDGVHWSRAPLTDAALGGGMPTAFAAGPSAAVSVGWTEGTPLGAGRELWQSADGISWTPANAPLVPPPPQVRAGPCPAAPTSLEQLFRLDLSKAVSCFGQTSLTLRAYSSNCGGCGGTGLPNHSPDWIANAYAPWYVSTTSSADAPRMGVWPLPSAHLTLPAEGTMVDVTGHFNDPVSPDCRILPSLGSQELPPPSDGEAGCRQAFVVTGIKVVS